MRSGWQRRLRPRIIASHAFVVLITTGLYGTATVALKERLETAAFEQQLRSQLEAAVRSSEPDRYFDAPAMNRWSLYRAGALLLLPEQVRDLAPGSYHSVHFDARVWHVEVALATVPGGEGESVPEKMILAYDITDWERREHALFWGMAAGGIGILGLALLLGWGAGNAIVAPVTVLRRRVAALEPERGSAGLGDYFAGSEIAPIAHAVDKLLDRIQTLVERERSFTSTASHELRSSLAVAQGALEVLEAQEHPRATQPVTARLRRALDEMHGFVEAALFLAREEAAVDTDAPPCNLVEIVDALVERYRGEARRQGVALQLEACGPVLLPVPPALVRMAVGNLLRNALQHSEATDIRVTLDNRMLRVADNGCGIPESLLPQVTLPHVSGSGEGWGLGLSLVKRICTCLDWSLDIDNLPDGGVGVAVGFPSRSHAEPESRRESA